MSVRCGTAMGAGKLGRAAGPHPWWHYSNWLWVVMVAVIIGGFIYPLIGLAVMVCFAGAIVSAMWLGRKWCGTVCPRGNFWDRVLAPLLRGRPMPEWARRPGVRVSVLVLLMSLMTVQIVHAWGDWNAVGRVFVTLLAATTAAGLIAALFTHPRVWCAVCPAGTMASWVGRGKGPQLRLDEDRCRHCNVCWSVCPLDLKPSEIAAQGLPTHADCLKCHACVRVCPMDALSLEATAGRGTEPPVEKEEAA